MTRLLILAIAWTGFAVAFVVILGGDINPPGCARVVGAISPECRALVAASNDHSWWTRTLPALLFVLSGYVVVGSLMLREWLRSRR